VIAHYDEQGNLLRSAQRTREDLDYVSSGCIEDENGVPHRVFVKNSPFGVAVLEIEDGEMLHDVTWLGTPGLIFFTPPIGGDQLMLGNRIDSNDLAITRVRLRLDRDPVEAEVIGHDVLDRIPLVSAGIDLDADEGLDVVAFVTGDDAIRGQRDYFVWASIAAGAEDRESRISGAIAVPEQLCYSSILTGDFDGDGTGDVIVAEGPPLLCGSFQPSRVFFYPMVR
jgi:hypothetical protein